MACAPHWLVRLGIVGLLAALALAGCGGDPVTPEPRTDSAAPRKSAEVVDPAMAAFGKLLDDQGRLTRAGALQVYAAAVGPLPGVEPAAGLGDDAGQFVGAALRELGRDPGTLTPERRASVLRTLAELGAKEPAPEVPVDVVIGNVVAGAGESAPRVVVPAAVPDPDDLSARIAAITEDFGTRSGHRIRLPIRVRVVPTTPGGAAITNAYPLDRAPTYCSILLPEILFGDDAASVTSTIAHEVWHCFQFDDSPDATGAQWIFEGQAEWAGESYAGGSSSSGARWDTWLLSNSTSLFRRSYDALGVYAVAAQSGADPWRTMLSMLNQSGARAVSTLFGGEAQAALRMTAEALTREPSLGANWESTGPGITGAENSPVVTLAEGGVDGMRIDTGPFGTMSVNLDVQEGDVLRLETGGGDAASLELQGLDAMQVPGAGTLMLCLKEGGCTCPDGQSPGGGDALPQARPGPGAASIGSLRAAHVLIRGGLESLEDACEEEPVTGRWHASVGEVWDQLMSAYGGGGTGMRCDGDYFMTLGEEGGWRIDYTATCRLLDRAGRGRARLAGTYVVGDGTLQFTHTSGSGTLTMNGITQPLPGLDSMGRALAGTATYVIEGNRMTVTTRVPTGAPLVINWTRVS